MAVTYHDVATTLLRTPPDPASTDARAWTMWIEDARRQIRRRFDLDALDQDDLDFVVREAVAAKARRPGSERQVSISVDDGSVSRTYETGTGQVTILQEWWDLLTPDTDESGAWTINPLPKRPHVSWC